MHQVAAPATALVHRQRLELLAPAAPPACRTPRTPVLGVTHASRCVKSVPKKDIWRRKPERPAGPTNPSSSSSSELMGRKGAGGAQGRDTSERGVTPVMQTAGQECVVRVRARAWAERWQTSEIGNGQHRALFCSETVKASKVLVTGLPPHQRAPARYAACSRVCEVVQYGMSCAAIPFKTHLKPIF